MNFKILFLLIFLITLGGFMMWKSLFKTKTILFLCVHNTFRSQMAEAYFNTLAKGKGLKWQAESAGFLEGEKINPKAIALMKEEGIDISNKKPKLVTEEMINKADKIIIVCKECGEEGLCINLPKDKEITHWQLENPAEMELGDARQVRDKIKENVNKLIGELK